MDIQIYRQRDINIQRWTDRQIDRLPCRRWRTNPIQAGIENITFRQINIQIDIQIDRYTYCNICLEPEVERQITLQETQPHLSRNRKHHITQINIQMDIQIDRQTFINIQRWTDIQIDRLPGRRPLPIQAGIENIPFKQINIQMDIQIERQTYINIQR